MKELLELSEKGFTITINCGMIVVTRLLHSRSPHIYIGKSVEEAVRQCEECLAQEQEIYGKQVGH